MSATETALEIHDNKDVDRTEANNQICTSACVNCGDSDGESWTLTQSLTCLVASGCVVIP